MDFVQIICYYVIVILSTRTYGECFLFRVFTFFNQYTDNLQSAWQLKSSPWSEIEEVEELTDKITTPIENMPKILCLCKMFIKFLFKTRTIYKHHQLIGGDESNLQ